MKPVRTAARMLLSGIFVASGARSLADPDRVAASAKRVTDRVGPAVRQIHPSLPADARGLVRLNGAAQLAGGVLLASGRLTRPAAALLAGSIVPTTIAGHAFWEYDDKAQRSQQQTQFLKNLAVLGGLMLAAVDTEGRPGVRWRTAHAMERTSKSARRAAHTARREARLAVRGAGRYLPR
ncbi:DoxX family protein [Rhizomonospora bruguierae]|uniref:DoxX family protein n=1 Tax=Rhizomonospora bruguierae TaxID=1581705 RepID=UPI001BCBC873|nr:DoxX family protein [Micromonospora sp. NBRC 107566]